MTVYQLNRVWRWLRTLLKDKTEDILEAALYFLLIICDYKLNIKIIEKSYAILVRYEY